MTGIELFILIGGCYALYTVGMAIATELDYRASVNQKGTVRMTVNKVAHSGFIFDLISVYNKYITTNLNDLNTLW